MTKAQVDAAMAEWDTESDRRALFVASFADRHPELTRHSLYAQLGIAVCQADAAGLDVEAWLARLRANEAKPRVILPMTRGGEE